MLSAILLATACATATPQYSALSLRPAQTLAISGSIATQMGFASDDRYDYLATAAGLFRATSILSSTPQRLEAAGDMVNGVAINDGAVYVLREGAEVKGDHATDHSLLRSTDHGDSFTPLDSSLEDCFGGYCRFLPATEIEFAPGRIFLGAGGNVLVTSDSGATWKILHGVAPSGKPTSQACPIVFHRIAQRLLYGGECPLDVGFVRGGELRSDLLEWSAPPQLAGTPPMENRNVQFITSWNGATFSGIEGALMKSCDDGATFRYVIHYALSNPEHKYPYIHQFLAPSRYPGMLIVAGFDKARFGPYLAWSADNGETWTDASSMIAENAAVALLAEGRDGLPLLVVQEENRAVVMEISAKKRSATKWRTR